MGKRAIRSLVAAVGAWVVMTSMAWGYCYDCYEWYNSAFSQREANCCLADDPFCSYADEGPIRCADRDICPVSSNSNGYYCDCSRGYDCGSSNGGSGSAWNPFYDDPFNPQQDDPCQGGIFCPASCHDTCFA